MSATAEDFWADVPLGPGVRRLECDASGLAALDKPEGVLSHPNARKDEGRSLVRARYDPTDESYLWRGPEGRERRLWLINRLDSVTSGVILVAADGELAREIRAQFRRRRIMKLYQALVFGKPRQAAETWRDNLGVNRLGGRIRAVAGGGNLSAESGMTLIRPLPGSPQLSLIQLAPRTGRSHQLRVQCARRGLPIVGDGTYGDFGANRRFTRAGGSKRMFLHCLRVAFEYEFGGREHSFEASAPLPPEFGQAG